MNCEGTGRNGQHGKSIVQVSSASPCASGVLLLLLPFETYFLAAFHCCCSAAARAAALPAAHLALRERWSQSETLHHFCC